MKMNSCFIFHFFQECLCRAKWILRFTLQKGIIFTTLQLQSPCSPDKGFFIPDNFVFILIYFPSLKYTKCCFSKQVVYQQKYNIFFRSTVFPHDFRMECSQDNLLNSESQDIRGSVFSFRIHYTSHQLLLVKVKGLC